MVEKEESIHEKYEAVALLAYLQADAMMEARKDD
jgi:hypothetical protein